MGERLLPPQYKCKKYPGCGHDPRQSCPRGKPGDRGEAELWWAMDQMYPRLYPQYDVPVVVKVGTTVAGRQYVLLDDLRLIQSAHDGHVRDIPGRDYIWYSLGEPFLIGGKRYHYGYTAYDQRGDAARRRWLADYKMSLR